MSDYKDKTEKLQQTLDRIGNLAVESFHYLALFIIGCMIAWSAVHTTFDIFTEKSTPALTIFYYFSFT